MAISDVFLSLGGNIGHSKKVLNNALNEISLAKGINFVKISNFYKTTPVSPLPQRYFINCACHIKTNLSPKDLLHTLQGIEKALGKKPKEKNAPRIIDIDIIFYGEIKIDEEELTIPHREWKNRLFVLKPLSDLQESFSLPSYRGKTESFNIKEFLEIFENTNNEKITIIR